MVYNTEYAKYLPVLHVVPVYPWLQVQVYPYKVLWQLPCTHGFVVQSIMLKYLLITSQSRS